MRHAMSVLLEPSFRLRLRKVTVTAATLACTAVAACSENSAGTNPNDSTGGSNNPPPATISALPRAMTATEVKVRDASNDFSFALLRTVTDSEPDKSTFISPLSASFALGMLMNGANGTTYDETQKALQLSGMSRTEINEGYKSLVALLLSLDPAVQLKIGNSIWYRSGFAVHETFLDSTKKYFDAESKPLNFSDVVASLSVINGWASAATNDKIKKVLNDIKPDDVMFLMNAIYFKGDWRNKFEASKTKNETFTPASGAVQTVPVMNRQGKMNYAETQTYQAVDLPYGNSAFSMTVVLPKPGNSVNDVAKSLTSTAFTAMTKTLQESEVVLALPKLKLDYERVLNGNLNALGMNVPFTDFADFTRMTPAAVKVSFVKQNSFVDVNEEGTEAAAVTVIGVQLTSAPIPRTVRVDRPYLFMIRERFSGTVLFMGRIVRIPG